MKFYIGSGLQNAPQVRQLAQLLKDAGWEHTYDWTASLHTPLSLDTLRALGEREFQGVKDADVVILLSPRGKGTHTEFGMALAWGKKVYLCHGDDSPSTFYCLPQVHRLVGDTEAIARQVLEG